MNSNYQTSRRLLGILEILFWVVFAVSILMALAIATDGNILQSLLPIGLAISCLISIALIHVGKAIFDIADGTPRRANGTAFTASTDVAREAAAPQSAMDVAPPKPPEGALPTAKGDPPNKVVFETYKGEAIHAVSGNYEACGKQYRSAKAARKAIDRAQV